MDSNFYSKTTEVNPLVTMMGGRRSDLEGVIGWVFSKIDLASALPICCHRRENNGVLSAFFADEYVCVCADHNLSTLNLNYFDIIRCKKTVLNYTHPNF